MGGWVAGGCVGGWVGGGRGGTETDGGCVGVVMCGEVVADGGWEGWVTLLVW